jgi:DNA-binding Lrp family transcriptional regulator
VLINTELGLENEVHEELKAIPEVKESYIVYGVYDIVTKIEAETTDRLKEVVFTKIRKIDSVETTSTMIVMK